MTPIEDAAVQRRRLRTELRRAREDARHTQRDVAEAMDWSLSKLKRIESGAVGISTTDLKALLHHYGVEEPAEVDRLVQLGQASKNQQAWWTRYKEATSSQYISFLGFENSAAVIQQFEPMIIPGLLQDEEYARVVLEELVVSASQQQVDTWVELRMRRQDELFNRPSPPTMIFVLSEAALRPWVGGSEVMGRQLRRLREEAAKEYVTIEVIPFSAGAHPGMKGPLVILQLGNGEEDVLFLENIRGDMISHDGPGQIEDYRRAFARLRSLATNEPLDRLIEYALDHLSEGQVGRSAGID